MKKVIRLTETDLTRLVKRVIKENEKNLDEFFFEKDKNDGTDHMDEFNEFVEEIHTAIKMAKIGGRWNFFAPTIPPMDLGSLIEKIREICDKYE